MQMHTWPLHQPAPLCVLCPLACLYGSEAARGNSSFLPSLPASELKQHGQLCSNRGAQGRAPGLGTDK